MPLGTTTRTNIADYIFNGATLAGAHTAGGGFWITLHTASPGADGQSGNEVSTSGTGYAPQAVDAGDWSAAATSGSDIVVSNSSAIEFGPAEGSGFGTVSHFGVWSHATSRTAADFLGFNALTGGSQAVAAPNALRFTAGELEFTLT